MNKFLTRLLSVVFRLFKVDWISLAKISNRSDLICLGSDYGGWVIPEDLFNSGSICYCAGCGEDITFDLALIERFECDVFAFDPTPRSVEYVKRMTSNVQKYHFYEVGLWENKDTLKFFVPFDSDHVSHSIVNLQKTDQHIFVDVQRLSNLMKMLGHNKVDLLKEGLNN